ncbi:Hpt domain-containing protein [Oribacterium sp. WCC10]|uniref:Hpt domain-containing protein n=1 Tax=Oribacterium sp. WCC10 TaxID=1855343 RepID=UPI001587B3B6|nr:Hpt domain-containing protein [Oribacterium sp. WCC10]
MMGNENFYISMISRLLDDSNFETLKQSIEDGDLDSAFDAAHNLKGVIGNLSLTPILEPVKEVTELLRSRKDMDYSSYVKLIFERKEQLKALFK